MALKTVPVTEAAGMVLPHDMTEIIPGEKKGPTFKKGHVIKDSDIPHLQRMGKNHIYVLELSGDELHEDEAALAMAQAIAGPGIEYDSRPSEGKVGFRAEAEGLLRVDRRRLLALNLLGEVMLATWHDNTVVKKGDLVAAGRAIPLVVPRQVVDEAVSIASNAGGLIRVLPWKIRRGAVLVTGQEVFEGRIKDAFGPIMKEKLKDHGVDVLSYSLVPDDAGMILEEIKKVLGMGTELILCTGGMSVDPDDVTRKAIEKAGATDIVYGSPVLPGAMFLVSRIGDVPVLGIPACAMYFRATVLDLVLPRVLAGERIDRGKIAALGHGGLCLNCKRCSYPLCPFGKG
ncbi:MAG: molybdopterin-binding protein [Deltaproteobacteria bacterium]|nr:molybdopterin-binding protein [Deltaproteobacteria bacterium]MBW1967219.1 molybdopterin-binding protein [Deltaproteobacteria bacterium]MBW2097726.1 molybdopterin-binding protein [Deltaproteobacteria bacterium]